MSKYKDSLHFHSDGRPGKLSVCAHKPLETVTDLSMAYSPGVGQPCLEIQKDPALSYKYTNRSNMVAVITNGTAVLGYGDIGALASKPVMEGKSVLFKRFADVDSVDLEIDERDPLKFIEIVKSLGNSFGGINLEDIRSPDCFLIERRLDELLDIPVFHDDQHGTSVTVLAGLINSLDITGKTLQATRIVFCGAGAAAISCATLICKYGMPRDNIIMCDKDGVIYKGRPDLYVNEYDRRSEFAIDTDIRTLEEALKGADMFIGLSAAGALKQSYLKNMAPQPIIFALANPVPEIDPHLVKEVHPDAIIATGRSDYPNQLNNLLCFPYIFRGALDVGATCINDQMKMAVAKELSQLARQSTHYDVRDAYGGAYLVYGRSHIVPKPFDPRLMSCVTMAVARAAIASGVASKTIKDEGAYLKSLSVRINPISSRIQDMFGNLQECKQRILFSAGEEIAVLEAVVSIIEAGWGSAILIGRENIVHRHAASLGIDKKLFEDGTIEIRNAGNMRKECIEYYDFLYNKLSRQGYSKRDCVRLVNRNRHVLGASLLYHGMADCMIGGVSDSFLSSYRDVKKVLYEDSREDRVPFAIHMFLIKDRTVFLADTAINISPSVQQIVSIAKQGASFVRGLGIEPRVALLSYESFNYGKNRADDSAKMAQAARLLENEDFEVDGQVTVDVALNAQYAKEYYPCSKLTGEANFLIAPNLASAHIAAKLVGAFYPEATIGPLLLAFGKSCQIAPMSVRSRQMVTLVGFAAYRSLNSKLSASHK